MNYDASNRKDIRRAEKLSEQLDRDLTQFECAAMDTVAGRRWMYHHLAEARCFVSAPTFSPNHDYFDLGRKSIGLPLMAKLQANTPHQYMQMIGEENARLAAANASASERSGLADPGRSDPGRLDGETPAGDDSDYDPYDNIGRDDE